MMTEEDLELRIRQETDPEMMVHLGGPRSRDGIARAHAKSLALAAGGPPALAAAGARPYTLNRKCTTSPSRTR